MVETVFGQNCLVDAFNKNLVQLKVYGMADMFHSTMRTAMNSRERSHLKQN
jgi:hypothetical protein